MTNAFLVAISVALLLVVCVHADYTEECPPSLTQCSAAVKLQLNSFGVGRCSGRAKSFCSAWREERGPDCFKRGSRTTKFGKCRATKVEEDVKCVAGAFAKALASAYTSVDCQGKAAYGCASATANAQAVACVTAKAIVDLSVEVGKKSVCEATVGAAINALATAAADAQAKCCAKNGECKDFDFQFAAACQEVLARAFASCLVYCDGKNAMADVDGDIMGDVLAECRIQINGGRATTGN